MMMMTITELDEMKATVDGLTRNELSAMGNMVAARRGWDGLDPLERSRLRAMLPSTEEVERLVLILSKMSVDSLVRRRHKKFPGLSFVDKPTVIKSGGG